MRSVTEIAGCSRSSRDDGAVALHETIEQRALAGVRAADDGHCQAIVHNAATRERSFKRDEWRNDLVNAADNFGLGRNVDVVFGEVDAGLEQGDQFNQGLLDRERHGG